jgi:sugar fermentation stimulation protein A
VEEPVERGAAVPGTVHVPWPGPLLAVRLVARRNRFLVEAVAGEGRTFRLHLPNSGRMRELLVPGAVGLAHVPAARGGRTDGVLLLVRHGARWVGVDSRLPTRLFASALQAGALEPFRGYDHWRAEVRLGSGGRLDFALDGPSGLCLVETKSCNRVDGGVALFPDAPSRRGTAHLRLLAEAVRAGGRGAMVWFVQRDDARQLRPFREVDPAFAREAVVAAAAGVELYAWRCQVHPGGVTLGERIPVRLDDG